MEDLAKDKRIEKITQELHKAKIAKARSIQSEITKREELPHLYRFKDYKWSKQFLESRNKKLFLVAANQLGKSSSQIRKLITWATEPTLWPELWPSRPNLFWYLYPTSDAATYEFETKWVDLLPRGSMKDHPQYGWEKIKDGRKIKGIRFNSGIIMLFKSYTQDVQYLQSGTVFYIAADEELPATLWDELKFRLTASSGYFSMVFTATLGQEFWRETMEEIGNSKERFVGAEKIHASLYDSQVYIDGTPSKWTLERIQAVEADCSSEAEVNKRVYGRFTLGADKKISAFEPKRHCNPSYIYKDKSEWSIYSGIDYGSGGVTGHPAAIVCVAVHVSYTKCAVASAWRGDTSYRTESGFILNKFRLMKAELLARGFETIYPAKYDYAQADLAIIAEQLGEPLLKADKSRERSLGIIDTLFKNDMCILDTGQPFVAELVSELLTLKDTPMKKKKQLGDDLIDAFRYAVIDIPFDWASGVEIQKQFKLAEKPEVVKTDLDIRRDRSSSVRRQYAENLDEELEYYNDLY